MLRVRTELFEELLLTFDLSLVGGSSWHGELCDPLRILGKAIEVRRQFRDIFADVVRRTPLPHNGLGI